MLLYHRVQFARKPKIQALEVGLTPFADEGNVKRCNCLPVMTSVMGFLGGSAVRNCFQWGRHRRRGFHPWAGKMPWRRAWPPTPVFLPGDSHGQRSLVGYSPWGARVGHD